MIYCSIFSITFLIAEKFTCGRNEEHESWLFFLLVSDEFHHGVTEKKLKMYIYYVQEYI